MSILYTQIVNSKSKKICSGAFSSAGNAIRDSEQNLSGLKSAMHSVIDQNNSSSKLYTHKSKESAMQFFVMPIKGNIFGVITDRQTNSAVINNFFEKVSKEYNFTDNSTHYEFDEKLKSLSNAFNKDERMSMSNRELDEANNVLVENLDTLINRGENIKNLGVLADSLNMETKEMSRKVHKMKMDAQMEQYKVYGVIGLILIIVLYFYLRK